MADGKGKLAAKKAWLTRRSRLKLDFAKSVAAARAKAVVVKPIVVKKPTSKGSAAAKKAWDTRRKNNVSDEQAEAERQEALRVLDELAKNRPPEEPAK